jgi:hypothetical protein
MNTIRNNATDKCFDKLTSKIHIRADESVYQEELFPETIDFNKLLLNNDSRFFVAEEILKTNHLLYLYFVIIL